MWKSVLALACILLLLSTWPLFQSMHCDKLAAENATICTHMSMKLNREENARKQLKREAHFTEFCFISSKKTQAHTSRYSYWNKRNRRKTWEFKGKHFTYRREVRKEFVCWWAIFFLMWPLTNVEKKSVIWSGRLVVEDKYNYDESKKVESQKNMEGEGTRYKIKCTYLFWLFWP